METMTVMAHGGEWAAGPGPWFGIIWLGVIATLAAVTVMLFRRRSGHPATPEGPSATAESVLAERFARGEISDDEYLTKVSVLRDGK